MKPRPLPTLKKLTLGMKLMRLSAVGSVEEAQVIAVETQGTIVRGSILTHRYGVLEVSTGMVIRGKNSWMPENEWKRIVAREVRVAKAMEDAQEDALDAADAEEAQE